MFKFMGILYYDRWFFDIGYVLFGFYNYWCIVYGEIEFKWLVV